MCWAAPVFWDSVGSRHAVPSQTGSISYASNASADQSGRYVGEISEF